MCVTRRGFLTIGGAVTLGTCLPGKEFPVEDDYLALANELEQNEIAPRYQYVRPQVSEHVRVKSCKFY